MDVVSVAVGMYKHMSESERKKFWDKMREDGLIGKSTGAGGGKTWVGSRAKVGWLKAVDKVMLTGTGAFAIEGEWVDITSGAPTSEAKWLVGKATGGETYHLYQKSVFGEVELPWGGKIDGYRTVAGGPWVHVRDILVREGVPTG